MLRQIMHCVPPAGTDRNLKLYIRIILVFSEGPGKRQKSKGEGNDLEDIAGKL